jgi:hypothetical protein
VSRTRSGSLDVSPSGCFRSLRVHALEKPQECLDLRNQHREQQEDDGTPAVGRLRLVARATFLRNRLCHRLSSFL